MIDFTEETKIYNAKVKFSYFGFEQDNTVLYLQLGFDYEGGTLITNKIILNKVDKIIDILKVLDLRSYEELPRKFARIKVVNKKIVEIGNLIENRWIKMIQ